MILGNLLRGQWRQRTNPYHYCFCIANYNKEGEKWGLPHLLKKGWDLCGIPPWSKTPISGISIYFLSLISSSISITRLFCFSIDFNLFSIMLEEKNTISIIAIPMITSILIPPSISWFIYVVLLSIVYVSQVLKLHACSSILLR